MSIALSANISKGSASPQLVMSEAKRFDGQDEGEGNEGEDSEGKGEGDGHNTIKASTSAPILFDSPPLTSQRTPQTPKTTPLRSQATGPTPVRITGLFHGWLDANPLSVAPPASPRALLHTSRQDPTPVKSSAVIGIPQCAVVERDVGGRRVSVSGPTGHVQGTIVLDAERRRQNQSQSRDSTRSIDTSEEMMEDISEVEWEDFLVCPLPGLC